ncbi:RHS repeat protein [Pseudoxanthomonas winnipegensis]|uniref:RHS repeat protein n=1 Tax=Pseudoxanthomonas winnipegensis TaxID=2480810 RepID=A0A4Q8LUD4_9GAMM|nr:RHS repeat protein [Pseudoxanthomonas winnipegensis]TAA34879.1 RHS repeat protein [Pseudoxanthomonas winnipegensis]
MVASDASCTTHWPVQQWRSRPVDCPQYFAWNGKSCVVENIVTLYTTPLSCSPCDLRANPISVATGNKTQTEVDINAPWIKLDRVYNSAFRAPGGISEHWTHSLNVRVVDGSGSKAVVYPNGALIVFENEEAIDGSGARLRYLGGEYQLDTGYESYRFNSFGRAYLVQRASGDQISIEFDSERRIKRAVHSTGRYLNFNYVGGPNKDSLEVESINDSDGVLVSYVYDEQKRLRYASYRDGSTKEYFYEDSSFAFALTGIADESGARFATFAYDPNGLAVLSEHAGGVDRGEFDYRPDGTATHVDALGKVEEIHFSSATPYRKIAQVVASDGTSSTDYLSDSADFRRRVASRTDKRGVQELFSYEDRSDSSLGDVWITKRTEAAGTAEQRTLESWRSQLTNHLVRSVSSTQVSTYVLNARGQALSVTLANQVDGTSRSNSFTYCEQPEVDAGACPVAGLLLSADGPQDGSIDSTAFGYRGLDDSGCATGSAPCLYRKGDLWKVTDALGHVTETLAYDGAGRPLSVKDPNGVITDYEYHPRGWLTATKVRGTDSSTESDDRITRIDYWPTGLVKRVTQPDGAFTAYTYDAAHRLTDVSDNAGSTIHYTLDNAGNRVAEDTKDANGNLKRTLSRVYNQLGQLATQADAVGNPTDYGYDANGNATSATDALSRVTQSEYDPLNRLKRTLQDVGGIAAETKFAYDALDNLTEVTDPKGLKTAYTYNGLGDLTKQVSPDTGTTLFTYDSAGNRITQKDARSKTTTYSYDALNRLTGIAYANTSFNVTYTYDANQSVCTAAESFPVGRLTKMQDGSGTTQYCYSRFGDLTRKVQTVNGVALTLRYSYAPGGQLTAMTYPDGAVVDYVRDSQGRITEVGVKPSAGARQVLLTGATYHPFGPAAGWTYGNGRQMTRTLDLDYRPATIHDASTGGLAVGFNYDEVGNLVELTQPGSTLPQVGLGYDALGRLTQFKDGPTGTVIDGYGYDKTGNRTSLTTAAGTSTYSYPTTSHRLTNVGGIARTYDAAGNTTGINGTAKQFVYDDTGRMSSVKAGGTTTRNYKYNGKGERVRSYLSTSNTYTLYDEAGHWVADYGANGTPVQQAIWMDDLPVGLRTAAAGTVSYIEPDHLGSPRVVIDPVANTAIWKWDIQGEAFGATAPELDPDGNGMAFNLDMRFPGQRYDAATGLNQNYFRDYESGRGRYAQSDPIGLNGGIATYAYVGANPVSRMDPLGLEGIGPWTFAPGVQRDAYWAAKNGTVVSNMSIGAGGTGQFLMMSGAADSGIAFDTTGNVCLYTNRCMGGALGVPLQGELGLTGAVGSGSLCSGEQMSAGVYWQGGAGVVGQGQVLIGFDGAGKVSGLNLQRGFLGVGGSPAGVSYAGGFTGCRTDYYCLKNESKK